MVLPINRWALAKGYGAHLIQDRALLTDMVKETKSRSGAPVSIKIHVHNELRYVSVSIALSEGMLIIIIVYCVDTL